jgi:hypothetical protein
LGAAEHYQISRLNAQMRKALLIVGFASVFYNGQTLFADEDVLQNLGIASGQYVTWAQVGQIMVGNARKLADEVDRRRQAGESGMPDTANLRDLIGRVEK